MKIVSDALTSNQRIPVTYTCNGPNISPPFNITEIPDNTKSLVLMIEDVDAPANPWVHWLVFNIHPDYTEFPEGGIPKGAIEGYANGGTPGYEGPCPIYFKGTHQYDFVVYALDKELPIPPTSDRTVILREIEGCIIEKTIFSVHEEGTGEQASL